MRIVPRAMIASGVMLVILACAGALAGSPARVIEERFVDEMTAGWESFEVCSYHSRRGGREAFFSEALSLAPDAAGALRESKELIVRESSGGVAMHLGVAELEFRTAELAARVHQDTPAATQRFLAATKVLTRYVTLRKDRRILLVYSETHLQPGVKRFMDGLDEGSERVWESR